MPSGYKFFCHTAKLFINFRFTLVHLFELAPVCSASLHKVHHVADFFRTGLVSQILWNRGIVCVYLPRDIKIKAILIWHFPLSVEVFGSRKKLASLDSWMDQPRHASTPIAFDRLPIFFLTCFALTKYSNSIDDDDEY